VLVGASQAINSSSGAHDPVLWTGVSVGVVGAALSLWETVSGNTQASAYNDAATHVRGEIQDFLNNIRSHDLVAGEKLNACILIERLCALRQECKQQEFDVSELAGTFDKQHPNGWNEDSKAESDLNTMCSPQTTIDPQTCSFP
jgi:hypothetical protein